MGMDGYSAHPQRVPVMAVLRLADDAIEVVMGGKRVWHSVA